MRGIFDSSARSFAGALLLATVLAFAAVGSHSIWSPDEPTGAAVGRAMLDSGDLIVPRLNGKPFLEKPALYWWVQVAAFRLFGLSDGAARLPSALFAMLDALVAWTPGAPPGRTPRGVPGSRRSRHDPASSFRTPPG